MSKCVVRMEMPSGCDKCPFMWGNCIIDEKDECYGRVHYNDVVVRISGNKYSVRKDRPSWCPILCELPEKHGRLVDAELVKEILKPVDSISHHEPEWTWGELHESNCVAIDNAPTIVPAERSEE